jgi:predicted DNA-binding antitoxin AbrB/MazE fold protein
MIQLPAIYEGGVFRPLAPLNLPEHARVTLNVSPNIQGPGTILTDSEFDRQLAELCADGPTLPANFARSDIYLDHD